MAILGEVTSDVVNQLNNEDDNGIRVEARSEVSDDVPATRGLWLTVPNVTCIFADIKQSTSLNDLEHENTVARVYTYFVRTMAVCLDRFGADYADIHGDGLFGIFSGRGSAFQALAAAITMKTLSKQVIADRLKSHLRSEWNFKVGFGIDHAKVRVRRLGLRSQGWVSEVWTGQPVNTAAKLSGIATDDDLIASERVFNLIDRAGRWRRRVLLRTCGCDGAFQGAGLDASESATKPLWLPSPAPDYLGLDFENIHTLTSNWCDLHGEEFCDTLVAGRRSAS